MENSKQIEIKLSKLKMVAMLFGAIVFVVLGILFVQNPEKFRTSIFSNPQVIFIVGLSIIVFFGFIGLLLIKKLFDKSPGLIISDEGVLDNSSGVSAGLVPWADIIEIKEKIIANQKFINLVVKNPQDYIDRQKSAFKRKALQMNYNSYGTVIGISANSLKCNYTELKELLDKKFSDYKNRLT